MLEFKTKIEKAAEDFSNVLADFFSNYAEEFEKSETKVESVDWKKKYEEAEKAVRWWNHPEYPGEPVYTLDEIISKYKKETEI